MNADLVFTAKFSSKKHPKDQIYGTFSIVIDLISIHLIYRLYRRSTF